MRTITWNFTFEHGTDKLGGNWSVKSIYPAFSKIQRYWDVNFNQVSRNSSMQIRFTKATRGASVPMWQSGKIIYASARYKWINDDQMILALVHEIGHWLVNGGGHIKEPGHIMSAVLADPYINFTQKDLRWFGSLPWKSSVRPWDSEEINCFRVKSFAESIDNQFTDVKMNCSSSNFIEASVNWFSLLRNKK